jgi:queuine tRNA-ribosyltransferase
MERTTRWLERCIHEHRRLDGHRRGVALFGICQGGGEVDLRRNHARQIAALDVDGFSIGGLSVGEPKAVMHEVLEAVHPELPEDRPRYLMGVGSPEDLWEGLARGIDLFDCVLPTRLARNGAVFTPEGRVSIKAARYRQHYRPIDETCDCSTCTRFSSAYLHHLLRAGEVLGLRLASVHNLRFLARQTEVMRAALAEGRFEAAWSSFRAAYRPVEEFARQRVSVHARRLG